MPFSATSMSPFLLLSAPVIRAAHVSEELRVEKGFGERAAVERDKRPFAPRRVHMDRAGDELLARSRFAGDEHGAARRSDGLDELKERQHRRARADDVRKLVRGVQRPLEEDVLLLQPLSLELAADAHAQLRHRILGLRHVVGRAETERLDGRVGGGEGGHHDADDVGSDALGFAQQVHPVHLGHPDVGDEDIDPLPLEDVDRRRAVLRDQHVVPVAPQHDRQQLAHRALVVDDENARGRVRRGRRVGLHVGRHDQFNSARALSRAGIVSGRVTSTRVPTPRCDVTCTSPP